MTTAGILIVAIVAFAAVVIVWLALRGTGAEHRAAILRSVAEIIRAVRGRI
ncbi:hypothetical protein [Kitasatospora sp. NPDC094011]|uniref:hypothetical protein n=1 Tax=Kitasatospora sp. NPDC094011 TaxID=3364090 RepID=UPI00381DECEB